MFTGQLGAFLIPPAGAGTSVFKNGGSVASVYSVSHVIFQCSEADDASYPQIHK